MRVSLRGLLGFGHVYIVVLDGTLSHIQISIVLVSAASWCLARRERVSATDWSYILLVLEANLRLIHLEFKMYLVWLDDAVCIVHLCQRRLLLLVSRVCADRRLCA